MLVEDEEHLAQGLLFNLEAEGYRTHHEADGNAMRLPGCSRLRSHPAVVLLDVMLPGRDGFSIAKRPSCQSDRSFPIIMLTARGRTEDVLEGFAAGADDYVTKPFDLGCAARALEQRILRRVAVAKTAPAPPLAEAGLRTDYTLGDRTISLRATLEVHGPGRLSRS